MHSFMVAVLTAWIMLIPIPGHASRLVHPPVAIPSTASGATKDQVAASSPGAAGRPEPGLPDPEAFYLPDLRTLQPFDLSLQLLPGGWRYLRLANTIWNNGQGPLEIIGEFDPASNAILVYQQIYGENGVLSKNRVGEMVWHPTHDHWHFDQFTVYELRYLRPDFSPGGVVASSDKLSYCMMDTDMVDRKHPQFAPGRGYMGCSQRRQGLSAGWGDTYHAHLDGQTLDITGLPDGYYVLISTVNPDAMVLEEDYRNNSGQVYLEIKGKQVEEVTLAEIAMASCDAGFCR